MRLSVIIPCLNAADTIAIQLDALANQRWDESWEVIVSDNGSTDETLVVVERCRDRLLPNLRIVDSSDRPGAAHARNVGALAATGELLAFCDADDEVGPGWIAAIGEALNDHDFVACRWDTEVLNEHSIRHSRGNPQLKALQRVPYPPYLEHASTCGLGVKRSVHEAVGGFDESLPRLMDTDYCFRIQLAGVKLWFVPDAVVNVRYRVSPASIFDQQRRWAMYNVLLSKKYQFTAPRSKNLWRKHLGKWRRVIRRMPMIRRKSGRVAWTASLGAQVGRLQGAIKYRVPPY